MVKFYEIANHHAAPGNENMVHVDARCNAGTTTTVWTPAAGKRIVLTHLTFYITAAGRVTVWHTTNETGKRIRDIDFQAAGGLDRSWNPGIVLPVGAALKVTSTGTGTVDFQAEGYEV